MGAGSRLSVNPFRKISRPLWLIWVTMLTFMWLWYQSSGRTELELQRTNNMLELQYHEMMWSEETFEQYCAENPEGCEVLQ